MSRGRKRKQLNPREAMQICFVVTSSKGNNYSQKVWGLFLFFPGTLQPCSIKRQHQSRHLVTAALPRTAMKETAVLAVEISISGRLYYPRYSVKGWHRLSAWVQRTNCGSVDQRDRLELCQSHGWWWRWWCLFKKLRGWYFLNEVVAFLSVRPPLRLSVCDPVPTTKYFSRFLRKIWYRISS
jgi:hypothetical protein